MVVLFRPTNDMLDYAEYVDVIVNPVACMGKMDHGIAKEMKQRFPEISRPYKDACFNQNLEPGGYLETEVERDGDKLRILTLATTVQYTDPFTLDDLENVLLGLRRYLHWAHKEDYRVLMPALRVTSEGVTEEDVEKTFLKVLDSLPNIITVTKRPEKIKSPPYFIGVLADPNFMSGVLLDRTPNIFLEKESDSLKALLESVEIPPGMTPYILLADSCNLFNFFLGNPIGVPPEDKGWCVEHNMKGIVISKNRNYQKANTQTLSRDLFLMSLANTFIYCASYQGCSEGWPIVWDRILRYRKDGVYKKLLTTLEMSPEMKKEYEESWKGSQSESSNPLPLDEEKTKAS